MVARCPAALSVATAKVQSFGAARTAAITSARSFCGRCGDNTIISGVRAVRATASKSACGSKLAPRTAWFMMVWLKAEASSV